MLTAARFLLVLAFVPLLGCVQTVKGREHAALRERTEPVRRVAIAPFVVGEGLVAERVDALDPKEAAKLLASHFAEGILNRGPDVISPSDVERALDAAGIQGRLIPRQVAMLVAEEFGADALLMGRITRLRERQGTGAGATRGATISFQADLFGAPGGARLWTGNVDETQRPLSENVLDASRYPGGGSRWLSAEEMLRWGAEQVVIEIPLY